MAPLDAVAWSAPVLIPGEPAKLCALMTLDAIVHFSVPAPKRLQATPLPPTLVIVFGWPDWPIVKKAVVDSPAVTAIPLVPSNGRPVCVGVAVPAPVIVLSWISSGLASLPIATA